MSRDLPASPAASPDYTDHILFRADLLFLAEDAYSGGHVYPVPAVRVAGGLLVWPRPRLRTGLVLGPYEIAYDLRSWLISTPARLLLPLECARQVAAIEAAEAWHDYAEEYELTPDDVRPMADWARWWCSTHPTEARIIPTRLEVDGPDGQQDLSPA